MEFDNNEENSNNKKNVVNFGLLIRQIKTPESMNYRITSNNQGINDAEVILIVETWLEKVKNNFKNRFKDTMKFHS